MQINRRLARCIYTKHLSNRGEKKIQFHWNSAGPLLVEQAFVAFVCTKDVWRHHDLAKPDIQSAFSRFIANDSFIRLSASIVVCFVFSFCYGFPRNSRRHCQNWKVDWPLEFLTRRTSFNEFFFFVFILFLEKLKTKNKFVERRARHPNPLR